MKKEMIRVSLKRERSITYKIKLKGWKYAVSSKRTKDN